LTKSGLIFLIYWIKGANYMMIAQPSFDILYPIAQSEWVREFELIEYAGRTAYKSEKKIIKGSYVPFIQSIIKSKHDAVLEFGNMTVKFITDRGVTHELVRHRLCSLIQESTRYCNYSDSRFNQEITVIEPSLLDDNENSHELWRLSCIESEAAYMALLSKGVSPQIARSVLPNSLKTEIVVKANFREWRHIFNLRVLGITGKPHPDMVRLMSPLYKFLGRLYPFFWDMGEINEAKKD
jgi:thymidylate synthase (FAD)